MGTPDFAVPALKALYQNEYDIILVVTQPDRPKGRGRKLKPGPVKKTAMDLGLKISQPITVKDPVFIQYIKELKPDFIITAAFGQLLPTAILEIPCLGAVNIHASLLPQYRGAAPIHWALINGEKRTGVTTMMMDKGVDTGDILLSRTTKIIFEDTTAVLHDRLALMGADLMLETLKGLINKQLTLIPQNHAKATYAPLFKKKDGRINWDMPALKIYDFIRGMTPWPGAFTFCDEKRFKIYKARPVDKKTLEPPGTIIRHFPDELLVATAAGCLSILEIQGAAASRLDIKTFLRGCRIDHGNRFV